LGNDVSRILQLLKKTSSPEAQDKNCVSKARKDGRDLSLLSFTSSRSFPLPLTKEKSLQYSSAISLKDPRMKETQQKLGKVFEERLETTTILTGPQRWKSRAPSTSGSLGFSQMFQMVRSKLLL
jgi:hypothetical protein